MTRLIKAFIQDTRGALLLTLLLLIPLFWLLLSLTLDAANSRHIAVKTKMALNRGVKAAVLALDEEELASGQARLHPIQSRNNLEDIYYLNLGQMPDILDFYICQGPVFPYEYNSALGISYTFQDPGVLAVVRVRHHHIFTGREQEIYVYAAAEVLD